MYGSNWECRFFFVEISKFIERYKILNETRDDEDEVNAGVHKLQSFGVFLTMDMLTDGDLTKHDVYWKLPAELVYTKLLLEKVRNDYQRDLQKIKELKANANNK